ncbi:CDC7 protein kinase [Polytolypa hystricis UAMH7299]|uniref:non-specific serine/threonine protein kinase n=1 Tax=Polytolypa hystricis (strain UAMH7299) TaxID=1447883 RepID=A0A2B7Y4N1_POLH7|nr:CDC7 protein kinase [Polytolypa hystricis UAMH7299]
MSNTDVGPDAYSAVDTLSMERQSMDEETAPDVSLVDEESRGTQSEALSEEVSEESEEEEPDELVAEDMRKLEASFKGISERFRLINRIGEGTFSTVYKAEDLLYDQYDNPWDWRSQQNPDEETWESSPAKRRRLGDDGDAKAETHPRRKKKRTAHYVALKKIYVTSSPARIQNELELLSELEGCRSVCPLITAFRHLDQVVAVLPYFPHTDFRIQYRTFLVSDMRHYFFSLFNALHAVHKQHIIHRDIKPTNFLYNPEIRQGVLVDFGLAEHDYQTGEPCLCTKPTFMRRPSSHWTNLNPNSTGYPKNDSRPSRRANRAGTRGFRAPEVLFKCTSQTTKIDIWSAGVILLTLLGRRFPFFNSADDVDAMVEIASIFGKRRMKAAAGLHGQLFETTIPTIGDKGYSWERIVLWSSCVDALTESEKQATRLLSRLMELDPAKRLSAKEALRHEFFTQPEKEDDLPWGGEDPDQVEYGDKTAEAQDQGNEEEAAPEGGDEVQLV